MGGRDGKFRMDMYTMLYLKWITNKDLLYSTGNSAQCYMSAWMRGEFGGEWIHEEDPLQRNHSRRANH